MNDIIFTEEIIYSLGLSDDDLDFIFLNNTFPCIYEELETTSTARLIILKKYVISKVITLDNFLNEKSSYRYILPYYGYLEETSLSLQDLLNYKLPFIAYRNGWIYQLLYFHYINGELVINEYDDIYVDVMDASNLYPLTDAEKESIKLYEMMKLV